MNPPSAIIAEDEPLLREELIEALAGLWPELSICAVAEDGIQAIAALNAHMPDVLFLDIQMPGMSGLEVAKAASRHCHVVFVTAYDQYAVAAFDEGAVDYVMKPFSAARLATAVLRLKARVNNTPANLDRLLQALSGRAAQAKPYLRWINVMQGQNIRLITVEQIFYFQADNKYTQVVAAEARPLINKSLRELMDELDPDVFWQIHRSTIVNVNWIAGVHRDFKGRLHVKLKDRTESLPVSEPYEHLFRQT